MTAGETFGWRALPAVKFSQFSTVSQVKSRTLLDPLGARRSSSIRPSARVITAVPSHVNCSRKAPAVIRPSSPKKVNLAERLCEPRRETM